VSVPYAVPPPPQQQYLLISTVTGKKIDTHTHPLRCFFLMDFAGVELAQYVCVYKLYINDVYKNNINIVPLGVERPFGIPFANAHPLVCEMYD